MKCPNCQSKNPEYAKFCNECGHRIGTPSLETPLLSFDEKLQRLQRYLPDTIARKILDQKDKLEGERRQVTIMFCDMKGFTPLTQKLGPEETFTLMDQVFEILIHKVHEYEGTVNELRGDGILALFGAPIAVEDAPQRALWSALAIHQEMEKFGGQIEIPNGIPPILLRIGINTGPVVVGAVGNDLRVQFTAVGDTINMAARMEELAEPGTTFVTHDVFRLAKGLFQFEDLGKKLVKGKQEPISVYKLLSSKEHVHRPRLGSERMIYSQMVGRDVELDRLELQVMKTVNGEGSIVTIIGEAGIGKSRLISELKNSPVMEKVTLLEGRAISIGRNLSFHPITNLLKQWAQIREDDGEATALGKLEIAVRAIFPDEVGEVLPFVATLMGMGLWGRYAERVQGIEGDALEKLIVKTVRELLIRASEFSPLVVVIEDLHWADISSIELLESLFRLAENRKICFVNVFRPGHHDTSNRIVSTINERYPGSCLQIKLDPLSETQSEALITNMLHIGTTHRAVLGRIVERASGNPFFIEEIVRSFIDDKAIVLKDGAFQPTNKIQTIAIPYTVNDVLMARIDRLDETTRNLVKIASVIGRSFFHRILSEVAGVIQDMDSRLAHLKEVQIIRERKRMGEVEYLFKHTLAQETAYDSILPAKRKELHLKVAAAIETVFSEKLHEFYGMLAYHYSMAESPDKAEDYLIKAGEEALKSSASNEALHYYQEAMNLYKRSHGRNADPEKVAMLEKNIAIALYNRGQYEEAVEHFDKALQYYWGKIPKYRISTLLAFSSAFLHFIVALYFPSLKFKKTPTENDSHVIDLFYKKCKALAIIDPRRFFLEALLVCKKVIQFDVTKFNLGMEIYIGASALFSFTAVSFQLSRKILDSVKTAVQERDVKIYTLYELLETVHDYFQGNWYSIRYYDNNLVDRNLDIGEMYYSSQHLYWHGLPAIYLGSLDTARSIVAKLEDIIETYENDFSILIKFILNSNLLMECRQFKEAQDEVEAAIRFARKTGFKISMIDLYSCKAILHIMNGDLSEAEHSLEIASEIILDSNPVPIEVSSHYRCRVQYNLHQLEEALRRNDRTAAKKIRKTTGQSVTRLRKAVAKVAQDRTDSYRLIGLYYWLIGKRRNAFKWWKRCIMEGERLGANLELSRAYFEIGRRLRSDSKRLSLDGTPASQFLEKAKELFEGMDLQWDLDQLSRLTDAAPMPTDSSGAGSLVHNRYR